MNLDRPSASAIGAALRRAHHITCYIKPRWSTMTLRRAIFVSNACWFLALAGVCAAGYFIWQTMQGYEQKHLVTIRTLENDNRSALERTTALLGEIDRLQSLNLYTSSQAIEIGKNMHLIMESGHGGQMSFLEMIVPEALRLQITQGVPAAATVAMAIYESNYGRSELAASHHNYFGIKANDPAWNGNRTYQPTKDSGKPVMAWFRSYPDLKASVQGYAEFLKSSDRYKDAFTHRDGAKFIECVLNAGYCPDKNYLDNIRTVMERHHLANLDLPELIPGK